MTYYDVLEITPNATLDEINAAYRRLSLLHHPDKNFNSDESNEKIKPINEAHEILSDEERRQEYDRKLNNPNEDVDDIDENENENDMPSSSSSELFPPYIMYNTKDEVISSIEQTILSTSQPHATDILATYLLTRSIHPHLSTKPTVLMFIGPPGTGKTESASLLYTLRYQSTLTSHQINQIYKKINASETSSNPQRIILDEIGEFLTQTHTQDVIIFLDEVGGVSKEISTTNKQFWTKLYIWIETGKISYTKKKKQICSIIQPSKQTIILSTNIAQHLLDIKARIEYNHNNRQWETTLRPIMRKVLQTDLLLNLTQLGDRILGCQKAYFFAFDRDTKIKIIKSKISTIIQNWNTNNVIIEFLHQAPSYADRLCLLWETRNCGLREFFDEIQTTIQAIWAHHHPLPNNLLLLMIDHTNQIQYVRPTSSTPSTSFIIVSPITINLPTTENLIHTWKYCIFNDHLLNNSSIASSFQSNNTSCQSLTMKNIIILTRYSLFTYQRIMALQSILIKQKRFWLSMIPIQQPQTFLAEVLALFLLECLSTTAIVCFAKLNVVPALNCEDDGYRFVAHLISPCFKSSVKTQAFEKIRLAITSLSSTSASSRSTSVSSSSLPPSFSTTSLVATSSTSSPTPFSISEITLFKSFFQQYYRQTGNRKDKVKQSSVGIKFNQYKSSTSTTSKTRLFEFFTSHLKIQKQKSGVDWFVGITEK